jgi:spore germination protein GerM
MKKSRVQWYNRIIASLIALIILVLMAGMIRMRTHVLPSTMGEGTGGMGRSDSKSMAAGYYLLRLNPVADGSLQLVRINRRISADTVGITKLLEELLRIASSEDDVPFTLIPLGVELLALYEEGDILYVDFSENFQFNVWGSEGYMGQMQQILYTIASASSSGYLQILIEGQQIDFLHEGIYIGQPIDLAEYR